MSSTLQRVIIPFKSELTLGDTWSSSDVFDSVSIRGAKLESDENMLPDSQSGFAPTVRGIAKSNAQVTIKQNGYVIYQTYTPPGPFEINDLNPTSSAGDLEVTIKESDNSKLSIPFLTPLFPFFNAKGILNIRQLPVNIVAIAIIKTVRMSFKEI